MLERDPGVFLGGRWYSLLLPAPPVPAGGAGGGRQDRARGLGSGRQGAAPAGLPGPRHWPGRTRGACHCFGTSYTVMPPASTDEVPASNAHSSGDGRASVPSQLMHWDALAANLVPAGQSRRSSSRQTRVSERQAARGRVSRSSPVRIVAIHRAPSRTSVSQFRTEVDPGSSGQSRRSEPPVVHHPGRPGTVPVAALCGPCPAPPPCRVVVRG